MYVYIYIYNALYMKLCIYQDLSCMNMQNIYLYELVQSFIYDVVL